MAENTVTGNELKEKAEYVESERKKRAMVKVSALIQGCAVIVAVLAFDFPLAPLLGVLGVIVKIATPFLFFLVMRFIWAPADVGWGSLVREGYTKAITIGGKRRRFIGVPSGEAYDEKWNVAPRGDVTGHPFWGSITLTTKPYRDLVVLGMHIVPEWPFAEIYEEATEWERWYPTLKKPLRKREIIREFTLLPYPEYIDIVDAEDENRLGITGDTNVIVKIVNPDKALFKETTPWIDIVRPLIQGGYVSYIKKTSFQKMLDVEDIGRDLVEKMPAPQILSVDGKEITTLVGMIKELYGIKILSISIINIAGADKELQEAVNAQAIAQLNKDARLIEADASAISDTKETMGMIMRMFAETLGMTYEELKNKGPEAIAKLKKDSKDEYDTCVDTAHRQMALKKRLFFDSRTDGKGDPTLLATMATANAMGQLFPSRTLPKPKIKEKPETKEKKDNEEEEPWIRYNEQ